MTSLYSEKSTVYISPLAKSNVEDNGNSVFPSLTFANLNPEPFSTGVKDMVGFPVYSVPINTLPFSPSTHFAVIFLIVGASKSTFIEPLTFDELPNLSFIDTSTSKVPVFPFIAYLGAANTKSFTFIF